MTDETEPRTPNFYFQRFADHEAERPVRLAVEGVSDDHHAMHKTRTYYAFVDATVLDGKKYLISDGGLKAELTYIDGSATGQPHDGYGLPSQYRVTMPQIEGLPPIDGGNDVILSINDASMNSADPGLRNGFIVSGTEDHPLLPSGSFDASEHYVGARVKPDDLSQEITYGSVFSEKKYNFDQIQGAWDVRTMDAEDFQRSTGAETRLFKDADMKKSNYTQEGSGNVVPYGWLFESRSTGSGTSRSSMSSSSADVMNSVMTSSGFKVGANFKLDFGLVKAKGEFSLTKNKSVLDKVDTMYGSETTYSEHKYLQTEAAYVLDKINARLNDVSTDGTPGGLVGEIQKLKLAAQKAPGPVSEEMLKGLVSVFGTHYCYAAVFGAKGYATESYSKSETMQLAESNVDISTAWDASLSVTAFGQKAGISGGANSEEVTKNLSNYKSATADSFSSFKCVGSGTCSGGEPGADGARVPVLVDLRPLSDLLGPPYFNDPYIAIKLKGQLAAYIDKVCFVEPNHKGNALQPSNVLTLGGFTLNRQPVANLVNNGNEADTDFQAYVKLPTRSLQRILTGGVVYTRDDAIKQFGQSGGEFLHMPAFTFADNENRVNGIIANYGADLDPIPVEMTYTTSMAVLGGSLASALGVKWDIENFAEVQVSMEGGTSFNVGSDDKTTNREFVGGFGASGHVLQRNNLSGSPHEFNAEFNVDDDQFVGYVRFLFTLETFDSVAKLRQLQRGTAGAA